MALTHGKTDLMATKQLTESRFEAAIISRMIHPERADLSNGEAQALLNLIKFDQLDLDRMHELVVKNQDDALTADEKAELETYLRLSYFVDLMHAKARRSLKHHN
jgi:hypothetical protein